MSSSPVPERVMPLRLFVAAVAVAGTAVIADSVGRLRDTPYALEWLCMGGLALVAGAFALKVPGVPVRISVSDTFFIASSVLFGAAPATVAIAIDSVLMSVKYGRSQPLQRVVFNLTGPAVALWVGARTFQAISGSGPLYGQEVPAEQLVLPLLSFAAVYFALNSGLTAVAIALDRRRSPLDVWWRHFAVVSINYFAAASVAFLLLAMARHVSVLAIAAVVPLFGVVHFALRSWTGRLEDAERHLATVDRMYLSTIEALSTAIEAKDGVTSSHIHRVQHYAVGLAGALGISDALELKAIQAAALLHDTGKLAVPERILNKPGKLTAAEFETMKTHVDVGADILSAIDVPYPVVPIVRAHHENWDGSGYPRGLVGEAIPIGARILSVVDCYDALTSDRPYRPALSDEEAMRTIAGMAGTKYDPAVVATFDRVRREIAPDVARSSQVQHALQQISRASEPRRGTEVEPTADAGNADVLQPLVSLARVVGGRSTPADVAAIAWSQLRPLVPAASCALFLEDPREQAIAARFAAGSAASVLQGLHMKVGERLSGWVADHGQAIVNSDATLDLGREAGLTGLRVCLALPLTHDGERVGVFTLYAADPFTDEQAAVLRRVGPHLAQMLAHVTREASQRDPLPASARPSALRVVASR